MMLQKYFTPCICCLFIQFIFFTSSVHNITNDVTSKSLTSPSPSLKSPRKSGLWQGSLLFSSSAASSVNSHKVNDSPSFVNNSTSATVTTPVGSKQQQQQNLLDNPLATQSTLLTAINESLTASNVDSPKESVYEGIYETLGAGAGESEDARTERLKQLNSWLSERDFIAPPGHRLALATGELIPSQSTVQITHSEALKSSAPFLINPILQPVFTVNSKVHTGSKKLMSQETKKSPLTLMEDETRVDERTSYDDDGKNGYPNHHQHSNHHPGSDDPLPHEDDAAGLSGQVKAPPCGSHGRFYCTYKEDYPSKIVSEVSKYYKWPLEKLFRDLRQQVMPKLANDNHGGLVCDSVTRVVRPGWARNTNNRWLVVINTDQYQQFVTEVICRNGPNAPCNYVPPCYQATCVQRYNTQKLMVIDPWNPYKGPYMAEFLFPSVCICQINYAPHSNSYSDASTRRETKNTYPTADRMKTDKPKGEL